MVLQAPDCEVTKEAGVVISEQCTTHPWAAAGIPIVPVVAVPPVPTLTVNATVPFALGIDGELPNPDEIVGAV